MLAVSTATLIGLEGCAKTNRTVIHPLAEDFRLVTAGEIVEVKKNGALVSDFWISEVLGVDVE